MTIDDRRITLVTRGADAPEREWDSSHDAPQRIIFVKAFTVLRYALANGGGALAHDIGRVVIDNAATASEFLELLTQLPQEFGGDVLLLSEGHAFLSATGRGGDRILYRLSLPDVDFYLAANGLAPVSYERPMPRVMARVPASLCAEAHA